MLLKCFILNLNLSLWIETFHYEHVRSWHVSDPYTKRYSAWATAHLMGSPGTDGTFNPLLYRFAVRWGAVRGRYGERYMGSTWAVQERGWCCWCGLSLRVWCSYRVTGPRPGLAPRRRRRTT